ncbi:hypothetical protein ADUPG1_000089 [Aduncisulcus paluster]|uniref:IgGFc-binding protein N-terminal domain-containing protein n=1 Tax=Aduncisulcus paluster TaxID=2918883 RepID=A0ABQ5K6S1_9EUKA|nr:hypothetical protein ADUPG1_000089 [Aduncisulcus paluster]
MSTTYAGLNDGILSVDYSFFNATEDGSVKSAISEGFVLISRSESAVTFVTLPFPTDGQFVTIPDGGSHINQEITHSMVNNDANGNSYHLKSAQKDCLLGEAQCDIHIHSNALQADQFSTIPFLSLIPVEIMHSFSLSMKPSNYVNMAIGDSSHSVSTSDISTVIPPSNDAMAIYKEVLVERFRGKDGGSILGGEGFVSSTWTNSSTSDALIGTVSQQSFLITIGSIDQYTDTSQKTMRILRAVTMVNGSWTSFTSAIESFGGALPMTVQTKSADGDTVRLFRGLVTAIDGRDITFQATGSEIPSASSNTYSSIVLYQSNVTHKSSTYVDVPGPLGFCDRELDLSSVGENAIIVDNMMYVSFVKGTPYNDYTVCERAREIVLKQSQVDKSSWGSLASFGDSSEVFGIDLSDCSGDDPALCISNTKIEREDKPDNFDATALASCDRELNLSESCSSVDCTDGDTANHECCVVTDYSFSTHFLNEAEDGSLSTYAFTTHNRPSSDEWVGFVPEVELYEYGSQYVHMFYEVL